MKNVIPLILILIFSQLAEAQKTVACNIEASINNMASSEMTTDRNGTNVRKGPGTNFPIRETLRDPTGFQFHITASRGNWVRIDEVFVWAVTERQKIDGWVYAPSLFLIVDDNGSDPKKFVSNLYAAPDWTSRLLFATNSPIEDAVTLQGCRGDWAKVKYKGKIGWLNPYSHCPSIWDEGPCSQENDF
jgi:uncharacterized protein YraI